MKRELVRREAAADDRGVAASCRASRAQLRDEQA
jgi:hypothetical protein